MYEKILIVDDEPGMVSFIKDALMVEGYELLIARDGEEAIKAAHNHPDLIILDIMMPGKNGFEVCQVIRDLVSCPIIFLSARQDEMDKVKGLALGGDDYIVKPFSMKELKMRIVAHLRREQRSASTDHKNFIKYDNLSIDLKGHEVYLNDEALFFTPREFDIIEFLALHPGLIFSKDQIYEKVWGYDAIGDSAGVAEHIKKIRAKFNAVDVNAVFISTVWGVGYKWEKLKKRKE